MNQSELEANARNRGQARENEEMIGFGFNSDWQRLWHGFFNQSESVVKQNQNKRQ